MDKILKSPRIIALMAFILVLGLVNYAIFKKEQHLAHGRVVLIELAPVDPRSLMQGDYMALRFKISGDVRKALRTNKENAGSRGDVAVTSGHLVASIDAKGVATFKSLYHGQKLADNEVLLQYRVRDNRVKFATNAFFFQEGHAKVYEAARYGQFRLNDDGELLLTAMVDGDLKKLVPPAGE